MAVHLCYRLTLSYRNVEELSVESGGGVSCEKTSRWCSKFGPIRT